MPNPALDKVTIAKILRENRNAGQQDHETAIREVLDGIIEQLAYFITEPKERRNFQRRAGYKEE